MKRTKTSNNEGASNLEVFMDNAVYKEFFDDFYFDELEYVLIKIDSFEDKQQQKIDELEEKINSLKEQLEKYE